jgi:predicted DNA-binding ribbon-helix-helix protein
MINITIKEVEDMANARGVSVYVIIDELAEKELKKHKNSLDLSDN